MPPWKGGYPAKKTIGSRVDNLIYERNKSVGEIIDHILYNPGPVARPAAFGAGAAVGLYVVKLAFKRFK